MDCQIETTAPGKVILHGEHAVVFGTKAVAVSVNLCTKISICKADNIAVRFSDIGIDGNFTIDDLTGLKNQIGDTFKYNNLVLSDQILVDNVVVEHISKFLKDNDAALGKCSPDLEAAQRSALESFLYMYLAIFETISPIRVTVDTELPVGAGLGSSASFAVALAGGLLIAAGRICKNNIDKNLVNRWAYVSERFVHGNPSGIDNSVVTFGGAVIFQKGQPLGFAECNDIKVLLVNTNVPRSTKDIIAKITRLKEQDPKLFESLIQGIEKIVEECLEKIKSTGSTTPELISRNQEILAQLNVSHPTLDDIVATAKDCGASAKLTGAGCGGCAFILIPNDMNDTTLGDLKNALSKRNYQYWETILGGNGFHVK